MHAEDDWFVPFKCSKKLIEISNKLRPKTLPPVKFLEFDKKYEYGHFLIYKHKELYPILK